MFFVVLHLGAALVPRTRPIRCSAVELQASLLSSTASTPRRGADATDAEASALLRLVDQLEPVDPSARDGWENSDALAGAWQLQYTSSRTYWDNEGLSGYYASARAADEPAIVPELLLRVTSQKGATGTLEFEERPPAEQAVPGGLAPQIVVECTWTCTSDGTLKVTPQQFVAGERSWAVQDRRGTDTVDFERDKAVRCLCACRPVFLDSSLLVLRGLLAHVVFVFVRS